MLSTSDWRGPSTTWNFGYVKSERSGVPRAGSVAAVTETSTKTGHAEWPTDRIHTGLSVFCFFSGV